jgi:hypothetical protein
MPTRTFTEIASLPPHQRQVALVRWSLIAAPDRVAAPVRRHDTRDPLDRPHRIHDHAKW